MSSYKLLSRKKKLYKDIFQSSNMNYFHTAVKKKKEYFINALIFELTYLHYCLITYYIFL